MLRLIHWRMVGLLILASLPVQAQNLDKEVAPSGKILAGAPGRIEGPEAPIEIGAAVTGVVEKVAVHQGDLVSKGSLLARIECNDLRARLAASASEFDAAKALYRKLINGPRSEEIKIAEAESMLAKARLAEAKDRMARSSILLSSNSGSRATRDIDRRDARMAEAQAIAARYRLQLLKIGTREEELEEAKDKMSAAQHLVDTTAAEFSRCDVKSPINGIVLRKEVSRGELVSVYYPKPLFTLSEIGRFRVRAEVDEHDIAKIRRGQKAVIVINASARRRLHGRVTKIAPIMGRRKILTSDPADKSDRDVMEVIIDLNERPKNLPIGLRVSVIFLE